MMPTPPNATGSRPSRVAERRTRPRTLALLSLLLLLAAGAIACGSGGGGGPVASPAGAEAQMDFGVQMAQRGLWSEALFRFERAARMDPSDPRALNNLAVACEATGQFDRALRSYQEALAIAPANRELRRNYARFVEFYQSFRPQEEQPEGPEDLERAEEAAGPAEDGDEGGMPAVER